MEDSPQIQIFNNDCLEQMKSIEDKSIDLIFCDLPYGQTSCKWDCKIDLDQFWKQVMRIKKLNTPIFFTTTTKFGVDLIQSAPKKCHFRYDLVWVKSAPAGFLSAKKMPMRKHEMVYVFYEKLPFYDLSSHKHKFIKEEEHKWVKVKSDSCYGGVSTEDSKECGGHQQRYDPPLPTSVVKEEKTTNEGIIYNGGKPLNIRPKYSDDYDGKTAYDPPLPTSVVKEDTTIYGGVCNKEENADTLYRKLGRKNGESAYDPPLPTSMLEIKSTRGKHSTEKPVALMEWIFKYYSKEGDTILDPTMGSGSTGVACKNMNRKFIGIEKDEEIFQVAEKRLK